MAEDDNYTFEALLQHTIDFLDAVGVTAAHLVGHSRGGHLVACIALRRPDLVKTLVIVDSSTLAPEDPRYPMRAFYVDLARRTPQGLPTPEIVRMEPDAQAFSKDQVTDDLLARMYEIAQLPKIQDAATRMRAVSDNLWLPSLTRWREEALRQIDERGLPAPTLLVWGYNDRAAPVPVGLPLFERIWAKTARAELHILYGSGHYSFRERPDAFNRLLSEFCLSHTA